MLTPFKFNTKALRLWRDRLRRQVTRLLFDRVPRSKRQHSNRVVFVRWDGKLGDSIVLSWVYRELSRYRPDLHITVLTHEDLVSLHRRDFGVEDVMVCSKRPGFFEIFKLSRRIKHAEYVVHLTVVFKPRDFIFLRCVDPAHVVGLDDSVRSVDIKLGASTDRLHFSQKLLPWLQSLGVQNPNMDYIVPEALPILNEIRLGWPKGSVTGFCPAGAGRGRQLSNTRICELLRCMRASSDHTIMLLVAPDQRQAMQRLLEEMGDPKLQLGSDVGGLSGLFATIRLCDVVVSVDTAVVHIASGLKKPLLGLYNPDRAGENNYLSWHPNSDKAVTVLAQAITEQHIDAIDSEQFEQAYRALVARVK